MRLRALPALVLALMLGLTIVSGAPAAAWSPPPGGLAWQRCPDQPAFGCATLAVPVDWSRPSGTQVSLAVRRLPAGRPEARIGPLFLIGAVPLTAPDKVLTDRFDLVSYTTHPAVTCVIRSPQVALFPTSDVQLAEAKEGMAAWYRSCAAQTGEAFFHDNSADRARDIDAIRAAMGEPRASLMHTWENEIVGQMYAELFPGRVRAIVLDGNLDHSVTTSTDYVAYKASSVEQAYDGFATWCARSADCGLHGQDVGALYDKLRGRAEQGALEVITPVALSGFVGAAGDYPESYYGRLDATFRYLDEQSAPSPGPSLPLVAAPAPLTYPTSVGRGLSFGSFCQDWNYRIADYPELQTISAAAARLAPHVRVNQNQFLNVLGCLGWPFGVGNPPHRLAIGQPVAALVVNGRYAPGQPTSWADSVAAQIPGSAHVVYEGPGTLAYRQSPCVRSAVDDFLVSLRKPVAATCPAVWPGRPPVTESAFTR